MYWDFIITDGLKCKNYFDSADEAEKNINAYFLNKRILFKWNCLVSFCPWMEESMC